MLAGKEDDMLWRRFLGIMRRRRDRRRRQV
jgi:hypothetical protein